MLKFKSEEANMCTRGCLCSVNMIFINVPMQLHASDIPATVKLQI